MNTTSSPSLTQGVYEQLRADLLACRLMPGERLRINVLCARLGVSLSAVREGLSRLAAEGLVVAEPQRGFRVAPISLDELSDLTSVRVEIEAMCLRAAIKAGDTAWEAGILTQFHLLSRTPESTPGDLNPVNEAWSIAHAAFHEKLVAACASPWLLRLRALLYAQSERYRRLSVPLSQIKRDLQQEHQDIMDATLARDADLAVARISAHIRMTTDILLHSKAIEPSCADTNIQAQV